MPYIPFYALLLLLPLFRRLKRQMNKKKRRKGVLIRRVIRFMQLYYHHTFIHTCLNRFADYSNLINIYTIYNKVFRTITRLYWYRGKCSTMARMRNVFSSFVRFGFDSASPEDHKSCSKQLIG